MYDPKRLQGIVDPGQGPPFAVEERGEEILIGERERGDQGGSVQVVDDRSGQLLGRIEHDETGIKEVVRPRTRRGDLGRIGDRSRMHEGGICTVRGHPGDPLESDS